MMKYPLGCPHLQENVKKMPPRMHLAVIKHHEVPYRLPIQYRKCDEMPQWLSFKWKKKPDEGPARVHWTCKQMR